MAEGAGPVSGAKVCFVLKDARLASCRVRARALVPALAERGIAVDVVEWPSGRGARRALWRSLAEYDAAGLFKLTPSLGTVAGWARAPCPLVYDVDDAVYLRQRAARGSHASLGRRLRFAAACRLARVVVAGNAELARHAEQARGAVRIVPSTVPHEVPQRAGRRPGPLRIGWVGGKGNLHELEALADPLRQLAARLPIVLVVIADAAPSLAGVTVEHVPWSLAGQEQALATLDVGIMPLADSPWARGKCAYKLLQYMAAGVAAVGSPVGMNAELITDGVNGRLAGTPTEWVDVLRELGEDPAALERLGAAGRRTVLADYTHAAAAARWEALLAELRG